MKRFVTYMYEYERGKRGRNIGFVRTDIREDGCRMELQIRGLDRFKGKCPVYLTVNDSQLLGIPVAEILLSQGMGSCRIFCKKNKLSTTDYHISQVQTLTVCCGNGKFLTGCLSGTPAPGIINGEFRIYGTDSLEEPVNTPAMNNPGTNDPEPNQNHPKSVEPAPTTDKLQSWGSTTTLDNFKSPDTTTPPDNSNPLDPLTTADQAKSLKSAATAVNSTFAQTTEIPSGRKRTEFSPTSVTYKKIEIIDIRKLPKQNWNLCGNSFLIHGFFNYHYLILKTVEDPEKKQQFLGVPGIYAQQERMMALLFGFPEFESAENSADLLRTAQAADSSSHDSQRNIAAENTATDSQPHHVPSETSDGTFGYWMCPLYSG